MSFDHISDMLTRIRNGQMAGKQDVLVQSSKLKLEIAKVMNKKGYIGDVSMQEEGNKKFLKISLKYQDNDPVIKGIRRVSCQGKRIYAGKNDLPVVKNGYGMAIISTSKGVLSNKEAREKGVGGEIICEIW